MSRYTKADRAAVAAMPAKQRAALFEQYADLLRTAWLNPSHEPSQAAVHNFEYDHDEQLAPFFRKWREEYKRNDEARVEQEVTDE